MASADTVALKQLLLPPPPPPRFLLYVTLARIILSSLEFQLADIDSFRRRPGHVNTWLSGPSERSPS